MSIWGDRFNLIGGLPSGLVPEGDAVGPTAVADAHSTLYIVIGEGNIRGPLGPPPQFVPNPEGLDSPIFSSVIRARFDTVPDGIRTGSELAAADITALADGDEVSLENSAGEHVTLLLLADFRDLMPDPVLSVRNANPFEATLFGSLTSEDLTELGFPGFGAPVTDTVPTAIFAQADGTLLVSSLSGFPFAAGTAKVYSVNPTTGAFTPLIDGLTTATNVVEVSGAIYVLEISTNFLMGAPGRLLRFASSTAMPTVVAGGLIGPTGLA
ncbi:MAG: hypothetical protein ABR576_09565 [Thermoanaerobaculia bacterium]